MKNWWPTVVLVAAVLALIGLAVWQWESEKKSELQNETEVLTTAEKTAAATCVQGNEWSDGELVEISVGEKILIVEIAKSTAAISQGLSGRTEIPGDGMLFLLPEKSRPSFWMKAMNFGLDLIWISDGKVLEITKNVPAPEAGTREENLPLYQPQSNQIDQVLEVESGQAAEWQIEAGDTIRSGLGGDC